MFKGGRELRGRFASLEARVNDWRFPALEGSLLWVRDRFEVTHASAGFYGGRTEFSYSMKPLGDPARPGIARFDVRYDQVSLPTLTRAVSLRGVRISTAVFWAVMCSSGRWAVSAIVRGNGELRVEAPSPLQGRTLTTSAPEPADAGGTRDSDEPPDEDAAPRPIPVFASPIGGALAYTYGPEWIDLAPGWIARPDLHRARGPHGVRRPIRPPVPRDQRRLAGERSPARRRHDRVRRPDAADRHRRLRHFDGVMRGAFRPPGGRRPLRRRPRARVGRRLGLGYRDRPIENAYADIAAAKVSSGDSTIDVDGRF